jgi:hypothetical protein
MTLVGPENLGGRQDQHTKGQSWCTGTSLRDACVAMEQSADLGDAHFPNGEQELLALEDEVDGGPDTAVATSKASGHNDRLSSVRMARRPRSRKPRSPGQLQLGLVI